VILLLDNYDSFTYNLAQYLGEYADVDVRRNDELTVDQIRRRKPTGIVVSPGPGHPANPGDFGVCTRVLRELSPTVPTLGVCLGHQGIVNAYGGRVLHARKVIHGKTSRIRHDGRGVFKGVPNPLTIVRYHSLIAERRSLPDCFEISALDRGEIMGVRHKAYPIEGVQFHPESIGTQAGHEMVRNFVATTRRRR